MIVICFWVAAIAELQSNSILMLENKKVSGILIPRWVFRSVSLYLYDGHCSIGFTNRVADPS